jgi:hypothetical protein
MAKKEGGVFCLKNCYQLLLHHHHAKGATCAFQFLTAAIVDNPKGEREGGGREEIIDTQWHQRTVKREKKANKTHWHYYIQSRKAIKQCTGRKEKNNNMFPEGR